MSTQINGGYEFFIRSIFRVRGCSNEGYLWEKGNPEKASCRRQFQLLGRGRGGLWSQRSKTRSGQAPPQEAWGWFPGWKVQWCMPTLRQAQAHKTD